MADEVKTTKLGSGEKITTLDSSKRLLVSDADGKQYYMMPVDEATELMKLMPVATASDKGLMPAGGFLFHGKKDNMNADDLTEAGWYYLQSGNTNIPTNFSYLIVFPVDTSAVVQFHIHNASGGISYRKKLGGSWRNWVAIVTTG